MDESRDTGLLGNSSNPARCVNVDIAILEIPGFPVATDQVDDYIRVFQGIVNCNFVANIKLLLEQDLSEISRQFQISHVVCIAPEGYDQLKSDKYSMIKYQTFKTLLFFSNILSFSLYYKNIFTTLLATLFQTLEALS